MSLESEVRSRELLESAFEKHRHNIDVDKARLAYEAAKEEWDNVATVEAVFRNNLESRHSVMPHITVHQALMYFQVHDLSVELAEVRGSVEPRGLCALLSCLLGPPELYDHLTAERDLVFAIAQRFVDICHPESRYLPTLRLECCFQQTECFVQIPGSHLLVPVGPEQSGNCGKLDMSESVHVRMLQTVYQRLTGTRMDCPCYGSHWEHIGFQGTDPGTDLRGVGMLGLLQLLYLCNTPHLIPLARDIYRVSVDDQQNFPLAVMSLNMTRISLQALRHGELNRECNHQQLVVQVVNQFYVAVFYHTLHIWTSQHKTIRDSGYVLKDVEFYCRGNVRAVLRDLQEQLASYTSTHSHDKPCIPGSFQDLLTQAKTEVFI